MRYAITLYWKGALVLDGQGTAVACYDTARNHIAGNFGGIELNAYLADKHFSQLMASGSIVFDFGSDAHGGHARARVERIR